MGLKTKGVLAFLLLSFGIAWATILVAHFGIGVSMVNPLAQLPVAFAPAIAALIVRRWVTREGSRDAGLRLRVRTARFYYLLAWIGPVLVLAAAIGLAAALGLHFDLAALPELMLGADLSPAILLVIALAAPVLVTPLFWGEEFGWTSYLQQRVSRSPVKAAFITGAIWAVWHYPAVFTDYVGDSDPALTIATWTPSLMAQAIVLAWLFLRSGSIWVASLAHAGNNLIIGSFTSALLAEQAGLDQWAVNLFILVPLAAVCAWILLTGQLRPRADATGPAVAAAELRRIHAFRHQ